MRTVNGVELPRVLVPVQAQALGLTRARIRTELRRGSWQRLATGVVLTSPDDPTRADWAEAGVALAGHGAAVTGWDALRVHGLGGRVAPRSHVVVLSRHGMNRVVGGVRLRRTSRPFASTMTSPLAGTLALTPIASTPRAVADACLQFGDARTARALVSEAIQRRACRVEQLLREARSGRCHGSRALRLALADAVDGARSAAEATAAGKLRHAAVPAFELNVGVVDESGREIYVVDALWRQLRAVLEIDSKEYHFSEQAWQATMTRHNELTRCGLAVAHYPPSAVNERGWADEVAGWLRARAAELGVPYARARGVIAPPVGAAPPPLVVSGLRRAPRR